MSKRKNWPVHDYFISRVKLFAGQGRRLFYLSFTIAVLAAGAVIMGNSEGVKPFGSELIYKYRIWADLPTDPLVITDLGGETYVYPVKDRFISPTYSRRLGYADKIMAQVGKVGTNAGILSLLVLVLIPGPFSLFFKVLDWIDEVSKTNIRPLKRPVPDTPELQIPECAMFAVNGLNFEPNEKRKTIKKKPVCIEPDFKQEDNEVSNIEFLVGPTEPIDGDVLLQKYLSEVFEE